MDLQVFHELSSFFKKYKALRMKGLVLIFSEGFILSSKTFSSSEDKAEKKWIAVEYEL